MSTTSPDQLDAIVIGAGVGGLRAAVGLQRAGATIRVLEARDRIGGRLLSAPVGEGSVDLGATWFWGNEPRVNTLVHEAGLQSFPQHLAGDMMFQNGVTQRISGNQLDVPSSRLESGMASIADELADQLTEGTIEFGHVVSAVTSVSSVTGDDGRLRVTSPHGSVDAAHVVLALPPALAIASIDFEGQLDDELQTVAASAPVWMGGTTKVVAVFDTAFWRAEGLAGAAFSHDGPMREIHDMSGLGGSPAALFGFCAIAPGEPAPSVEQVTEQLVAIFGPKAASPIDVHVMDWRNEPFTTPPEAAGLTDYATYGHRVFQQPALDGRLHWASTETSPAAPGHVEGALAAADRAVAAITIALKTAEQNTTINPRRTP